MSALRYKIGHRGAPREFPANTLRSFQRAVELGCNMVECDVRESSDGVLVLAHDPDVTDANGRRYVVSATTSVVLSRLDLGAGEGVPALTELVAWASRTGTCAVMVDMKVEGGSVEEKAVAALSLLPVTAKIVAGAGEASRKRFRELDATLPLALTVDVPHGPLLDVPNLAARVSALYADAVTWEHPLLTPERITELQAHGLTVFAWTVDDFDIMRRLADDGVDGIISNRPDLLVRLV